MKDLKQFFDYMNDVDFRYVVLRNWENLPYKAETGAHSDLDLLVYDLDHFLEIFPDLERVYPEPRVQFKLHLDSGEYIQIDARHLGDDYYPEDFENAILVTREYNSNGFWTPNPVHHRLALAYHVVHHKNGNNYEKHLGKVAVKDLAEALKASKIGWVEPMDPSVGSFNAYMEGATSSVTLGDGFVEKKQVRFKQYDLVATETWALERLDSPHFPKLLSSTEDSLLIEHCGEPLSVENLPDNWLDQLGEILLLLDAAWITHRDIRLDNLMLRDDIIMLLDFGWARETDAPDGKHPDLLGYPNKCPLGFNDRYSMNCVIKQLNYELEELCSMEG